MINIIQAQMYCAQPIELIENYQEAVNDETQVWHCHHVWETMLDYTREELIEMNEYYGIPACNLIFLKQKDHNILHNKGKKRSEETCKKISESLKGENHPLYGKTHSLESCKKMSESHKGKYNTKKSKQVLQFTKEGNFVAEYPSSREVQRQLGYSQANVSRCCVGEYKTAYGFIWKYKE